MFKNTELSIIRIGCLHNQFLKLKDCILLKDLCDEVQPLWKLLCQHHSLNETDISVQELANIFFSVPRSEKEYYNQVFQSLSKIELTDSFVSSANTLAKSFQQSRILQEISLLSYDCSIGRGDISTLNEKIKKFVDITEDVVDTGEELPFVDDNLVNIAQSYVCGKGLNWRLNTLNRMLGPLRTGDFGFIFARPESFSRDTEVLTPDGWLTVDKVTTDTFIAQVHCDLKMSFVKPSAVHPHEQTHCYHIHDTLGRVDLIVTQGHGMIYEEDGVLYRERADTVKYRQGFKHHVAAQSSITEEVPFLPIHRLLIAYQADGHTRNYKEYGYTFSFLKERKKQRLREILDECGFPYTEYKDGNRGHTGFYIKTNVRLEKHFGWVDLYKSKEWCQQFIEELSYWDSTRRTDTRFKFDTADKDVADKVQAIAVMAGYNCLLSVHVDERSPKYKDIYSLSIRKNYTPVDGQSIKKDLIPFTDTTYCFEVPTGMLLVRRNGAVALSGNTGKTTMLASEATFMAEQIEEGQGPVLWINNEESDKKVIVRIYTAALGIPHEQILKDPEKSTKLFKEKIGDKLKLPQLEETSKVAVEKYCEKYKPSLIILDQIDKITGFDEDRDDLKMGKIYQWARGLAKKYAPVIGVCQADATGEGKKWLTMANVAQAKTAKQAEADWIVGIGKIFDDGYENVRFLCASKNKLLGGPMTDQSNRHGKCEVMIDPVISRYVDIY